MFILAFNLNKWRSKFCYILLVAEGKGLRQESSSPSITVELSPSAVLKVLLHRTQSLKHHNCSAFQKKYRQQASGLKFTSVENTPEMVQAKLSNKLALDVSSSLLQWPFKRNKKQGPI